MERNIQKTGLINWVALLLAAGASAFVANYTNSHAAWVGVVILGLGFFIGLVSYFQMRLEEREKLEKLEFDELNREKKSSALFSSDDAETFPARRSREQFERFFVPFFALLLVAVELAVIYWQWNERNSPYSLAPGRAALAMSLFGLLGIILFVLGKYSAGITRLQKQRLLQPGAGFLLLGSYVSFLLTINMAATEGGFKNSDRIVAGVLTVLLALSAFETIISLIFEIYRPRFKGKPARVVYDSRLIGLLAHPEGIIRTAAQALDYQFGFKVSDTWFYKFLERSLAWLILLQVGVLLLSTSVVFIEPGEQGILERFGKPVASRHILQPGAHMKLPWPVDKVQRYSTSRLQSFNIGFEPDPEAEKHEKTVLWTVKHYKEESNMLVASKDQVSGTNATEAAVAVSLITVSIPVQYQVRDVLAFAYNYSDAGQLLQNIAAREVTRYLVGVDLNDIMASGRAQAAQVLRTRIQAAADQWKLGVDVLFVGLQDIHPPVKVAPAYEDVIGAQQELASKILVAEAEKARVIPLAKAEAERQVREAESYRFDVIANAQAVASQFTNQMASFQIAPTVYKERLYLQRLSKGLETARKIVIGATNTHDTIQYNLEEKVRPDLLDVTLPTKK